MRSLWDDFQASHIDAVFEILHTRFGFPMRRGRNVRHTWKEKWKEYYNKQPHSVSELSAFMEFGDTYINRILNAILLRPDHYSTFPKIVEHVILTSQSRKDRIAREEESRMWVQKGDKTQ
jgi:hypothetical protein